MSEEAAFIRVFLRAFLRYEPKTNQQIEAAMKDIGVDIPNWQREAKKVAIPRKKAPGISGVWEWVLR